MAKLRVKGPDGSTREVEAGPARSILNNLLLAGVPIRHDCGGKTHCGTCMVNVSEGLESLSPVEPREALRLSALDAGPGRRLACQARAVRDAAVEVLDDGRRDPGAPA